MEDRDHQFERVRNEADPLRQAKLAGELIARYQQRSIELARLRKEAINRAAADLGMSFSSIASELGLTRGRITQIRQTAPPAHREFFGVGPVTVAIPLRKVSGRALPMVSSEDVIASEGIVQLLAGLAFQVEAYRIPAGGEWRPRGDTVAICGPKSSPVTADAIAGDPFLAFEPERPEKWVIRERDGSRRYESPMDDASSEGWSDIAYVGRLALPERAGALLVVAGVHALGSVGAVHYVTHNLADLYQQVGTQSFSMVVRSEHLDGDVLRSELICPPRIHRT